MNCYTIIMHQIRKELDLSLMEYCLADSIYHLSNNPSAEVKGWCYASKDNLAEFLGTTRATVFTNLKSLIEKKLIEKDATTRHLRTTEKWYKKVVLMRAKEEYKETLHIVKKLDGDSKETILSHSKETIPYSNILDSNINSNTLATQNVADNNINLLLEKFKPINPSYERLYPNKSQRAALTRMVKKYTYAKMAGLITALPELMKIPYAPQITTPMQLEDKLGRLLMLIKKANQPNVVKL